jgi:hypothetical protein
MLIWFYKHSTVSADESRLLLFELLLLLARDGALRQRPDRREDQQRGHGRYDQQKFVKVNKESTSI